MIVPLTINSAYLPSWGVAEGLRELVQNWLDASDDVGEEGTIAFVDGVLTLTNPGAVLGRDALLIGTSTKVGVTEQRGQFGEGLKLGTLALVREGKAVIVKTPSETWTAHLGESETFPGMTVLIFDVVEDDESRGGVSVEVSPVADEEYEDTRRRFRRFAESEAVTGAYHGALLARPEDKGRIYVKGIYVASDKDFEYGYDLTHTETDRDRKLVSKFDLQWATSDIAAECLPPDRLLFLLASDKDEVRHVGHHIRQSKREGLAACFRLECGENAIPAKDAKEADELEHYGYRGVVCPEVLRGILEKELGTYYDAIKKACEAPVREYDLGEVSDEERENFEWVIAEVSAVAGPVEVTVADFREPKTLGIFKGGELFVARKILKDKHELLATVVHEVAHWGGGDGRKGHVSYIEHIWTELARRWV